MGLLVVLRLAGALTVTLTLPPTIIQETEDHQHGLACEGGLVGWFSVCMWDSGANANTKANTHPQRQISRDPNTFYFHSLRHLWFLWIRLAMQWNNTTPFSHILFAPHDASFSYTHFSQTCLLFCSKKINITFPSHYYPKNTHTHTRWLPYQHIPPFSYNYTVISMLHFTMT